jgi:hypothetical protein
MVCKENYKTKPIRRTKLKYRTNWQFLYNHVRNNDLPKRLQTILGNKVLKAPEPYFRELEKANIPELRKNFWSYSRRVNHAHNWLCKC